jgi:hypothetical protein
MKPRKGDLLRQVSRVRQLARRYGLPLLFDGGQLEMFTAGELWAYFYNLSDSIKSFVLDQNQAIAQRWKFPDDMPVWEFIERIDRLRAHSQSATPDFAREIGLEPTTTAVESLQRNGMVFVRTVKRD